MSAFALTSLVDLKYLLDKEETADLLVSTMARRAPSKLSLISPGQSQSVLGKNVLNA
jgi:hypothetical protein